MSKKSMFPVALDLGAANTGIFAVSYTAGSSDLKKHAFTAKVPTIKGCLHRLMQQTSL